MDEIRALVMRNQLASAGIAIEQALGEHPSSTELRRLQAGILQRRGREADAESVLKRLLQDDACDVPAAFTLAHLLRDQARMAAAAGVLRHCFATDAIIADAGLAITAIELLDDCDRKQDAVEIAEAAIVRSPNDSRLHAYSAMLHLQLGQFERARRSYLFALEHDARAWEWRAPIGLSSLQRYRDATHPDLGMFRDGLCRPDLSRRARAELHFALAKALDDIGDCKQAASHLLEGNAIADRDSTWSRKAWRRAVDARLASPPWIGRGQASTRFTPIFIVGMPRSGTTLLADLLSRRADVCNRGELPWLARIAAEPAMSGAPSHAAVQDAAAHYARQARRDDAGDARWFIDKQPLNFRYLDLALAMFPDARVIYCARNRRDIALSLWTQCFLEDVQGYAYDFGNMAMVMRDCDRLMSLWRSRYPEAIRSIAYEDLVTRPGETIAGLCRWIGLPDTASSLRDGEAPPPKTISTASAWQARQPVHTRSIARWERYASFIPGLLTIPDS